jgi:hypothetical protein
MSENSVFYKQRYGSSPKSICSHDARTSSKPALFLFIIENSRTFFDDLILVSVRSRLKSANAMEISKISGCLVDKYKNILRVNLLKCRLT